MILRPFTPDDIDELLRIAGNPEVTRYTPNLIRDRETLVSWMKGMPATDHEYMILQEGQVIGECSLDENGGEIGIMLYPEYWHQGYGTAAVKELMKIAESLGMDEVSAQTDRNNAACIGLLESLGFIRCGIGWAFSSEDPEKPLDELQQIFVYRKRLNKEAD